VGWGGPCAQGQPLPTAGPILPGQQMRRGWVGGRGTCPHWGRRGVSSPALPPWPSPAAPWPGAQPPCAGPPGPPPARCPSPRGGWCTTRLSPGGAGRGVSPRRPAPKQPQARPRDHLPPQHPLTRAGAHHHVLWARWEETTPKSCLLPRQGSSCPVASRRGYGRPRAGAAVPTAPAGNVTPSWCRLPSCCRRPPRASG